MMRMLFKSLASVSLILCLATIVFWVRSYPARDVAGVRCASRGYHTAYALGTDRGLLAVSIFEMPDAERAAVERALGQALETQRFFYVRGEPSRGPERSRWWNGLGFAVETSRLLTGLRTSSTIVFIPMWLPLLITLAAPTAQLTGHLRRVRRRIKGRCPACGYDLRASPNRCPECGATPLRRLLLHLRRPLMRAVEWSRVGFIPPFRREALG